MLFLAVFWEAYLYFTILVTMPRFETPFWADKYNLSKNSIFSNILRIVFNYFYSICSLTFHFFFLNCCHFFPPCHNFLQFIFLILFKSVVRLRRENFFEISRLMWSLWDRPNLITVTKWQYKLSILTKLSLVNGMLEMQSH